MRPRSSCGGKSGAEGGVLRTESGEEPYNDIEFYVFLRGSRLWNQQKFGAAIGQLAGNLSAAIEKLG